MSQHVVRVAAVLTLLLIGLPVWATEEVPEAMDMLPPSGALPGWLVADEPEQFASVDLWKHINGAAEQYLSFGCESLTVGYYKHEESESEITVEIYRMKDELGTFGLYTQERPPEGPFLQLGAEGYQARGQLNFFGGLNYIKLQVYPVAEAELQAERDLAGIIAGKHLADSTFPKELALFPRDKLVEDSFGLAPKAVLGLSGVNYALFAKYRSGESETILHFIREKSAEAAEKVFSAARESLTKRSEAPLREVMIGAGSGVQAELKYYGSILLLRSGKDILLASGATEQDWVRDTISTLLSNLAR